LFFVSVPVITRPYSYSRVDLRASGYRVAEEIIFGADRVTSGASSDFEQATAIAMNMVERWGMSDKLGFVAHKHLTGGGRNTGEAAYR
jgi:cell division protease FtsH